MKGNLIQLVERAADGNGNIPRLWVVYNKRTGMVVDILESTYTNKPEQYRGATELPRMILTNRDYKGWEDLRKQRKGLTA